MTAYYNARGNTYFVATPEELNDFAKLPRSAKMAADSREHWARSALSRICLRPSTIAKGDSAPGNKPRSNGLLIGPFLEEEGFGLLILNTDGTLAERSGNGLTIFSQYLVDTGRVGSEMPFDLHIYHDNPESPSITARIEPSELRGRRGFWVDMGIATFGAEAVNASPNSIALQEFNRRNCYRVEALEQIHSSWACSQFVNLGNPHCVTILGSPALLPSMEQLESDSWKARLSATANSSVAGENRGDGRLCENGINLQWAAATGPSAIQARIFERGEGATMSSGSSAVAVASAGRYMGLLEGNMVSVEMPGGTAPVRFEDHDGTFERLMLFGQAEKSEPP